jgi:SAM-dependent methyltransferase
MFDRLYCVMSVGEQIHDELGQRDREHAEMAAQVRRLTEERDELGRQLKMVYSSKSWALTAPMRKFAELSRSRIRGETSMPTTLPVRDPDVDVDVDLPPPELRTRVAGGDDADWFRSSGRMALEDISAALAAVNRSLGGFTRIYDFGCGCGRISLPLTDIVAPARLTATDADGEAVDWLRARLPVARVEANGALPPLPFADDSFDLIIAWSVLTHLPEHYQDAWLAELARVLSSNGVMLLTVHGPTHFDIIDAALDDPKRKALPEEGLVYIENYGPDSPFAPYYQTTYHHPDYIREHWSQWVNVLDIHPGAARPTHDMVVTAAR